MNVTQITMPAAEAQRRLRAYRTGLRRRVDVEYQAVAQGLEALARGTPLLDLYDVIRQAPTDERGRPKLAVARADRQEVQLTRNWQRSGWIRYETQRVSLKDPGTLELQIPLGRDVPNTCHGWAMVPLVPPDVLGRRDRRSVFVLWEVEQWHDRSSMRPDRDPLLLQHLGGSLFAVVGSWDLTELERAVMAGRAR